MKILFLYFRKLFSKKYSYLVSLLVIVVSLYFMISGCFEYRAYQKEVSNFINLEKLKNERFFSYQYYGAVGFRALFTSSSLDVLFDSDSFLNFIEANIDASEIVEVFRTERGKSQFNLKQPFSGFANFLIFFGSLGMILLGLSTFSTSRNLTLHSKKSVYSRIVTNIVFISSILIGFCISIIGIAKVFGIDCAKYEITVYLHFLIFLIVFLMFFYLIGFLLWIMTMNDRKMGFFWGFVIWSIINFFIPSISGKILVNEAHKITSQQTLNANKLNRLLEFESHVRDYFSNLVDATVEFKIQKMKEIVAGFMKEEYVANKADELAYLAEVEEVMDSHGRMALIFPTIYSNYLVRELSSRSYYNYKNYLRYVLELREQFLKYYLTKRYSPNSGKVEPFVKGDENIFRAESRLPDNFWAGISVLMAYCLGLLAARLFVLRVRMRIPVSMEFREGLLYRNLVPDEAPYFFYCQSEEVRQNGYEQISIERDAVGMDNLKAEDIDPGLPAKYILPYLYHIRQLTPEQIKQAEECMRTLGLEDLENFHKRKRHQISDDDFKRIYAGIVFAQAFDKDINVLVINKFLSRMSHEFEVAFQEIMYDLRDLDKWVIYLDSEMFIGMAADEDNLKVASNRQYSMYHIDHKSMSFR